MNTSIFDFFYICFNVKTPILQGLTVNQIKKIRVLIDEAITKTDQDLHDCGNERNKTLFEIGNLLHETCVISNNEVTR